MPAAPRFAPGGYRFLPGGFPYSAGVAAEPGFQIERARFARPLPLAEGFAAAEAYLTRMGSPRTALAACELRSPRPYTEAGFAAFNRQYVEILARWGLYREDVNPVARTNVCPLHGAPSEPTLFAFCYTVERKSSRQDFVLSGAGEVQEGPGSYLGRIAARGDLSREGLRTKMRCVMGRMEQRLEGLGFRWADALAVQMYTLQDVGPLIDEELLQRGAGAAGLTWHVSRLPLEELEFELDVQAVSREVVL